MKALKTLCFGFSVVSRWSTQTQKCNHHKQRIWIYLLLSISKPFIALFFYSLYCTNVDIHWNTPLVPKSPDSYDTSLHTDGSTFESVAPYALLSLLAARRLLALALRASCVKMSCGSSKSFFLISGKGCPKANRVRPRRCLPSAASRRCGFS